MLITSVVHFQPHVSFADVIKDPTQRLEQSVHKFTLSNGMRVVLVVRNEAPVFSGQVWVKVGGVNEVPGITGISHLLEHMAFKGSRVIGTNNYKNEKPLLDRLEQIAQALPSAANILEIDEVKEIQKKLEQYWKSDELSRMYIQRGAVGLNAQTGKDYTVYLVNLPKTAFELWCWLESDRLLSPVFRQFYEEREVVMEERRTRFEDSPDGKLYGALIASAFWSHPNRLPVIGWPSDLKELTATKVGEFYEVHYRPENIVLSLAGDLDPEIIKPILEKYFSRISIPNTQPPQIVTKEEQQMGERDIVVKYDADARLMLGYHKPVYPHPDDLYFSILHELLSGGRSSILHKELVIKKQLAVSVSTFEAPGEQYPNLFVVYAMPKSGVSNERLRVEIQNIFDKLGKKYVTNDELEAAKKRVKASFIRRMSSNSGLARMFGKAELLWDDWRSVFEMYDMIFSTTSEDISRITNNYLIESNRTYAHLERLVQE
jgi:predicted Zn-dependent peptidase